MANWETGDEWLTRGSGLLGLMAAGKYLDRQNQYEAAMQNATNDEERRAAFVSRYANNPQAIMEYDQLQKRNGILKQAQQMYDVFQPGGDPQAQFAAAQKILTTGNKILKGGYYEPLLQNNQVFVQQRDPSGKPVGKPVPINQNMVQDAVKTWTNLNLSLAAGDLDGLYKRDSQELDDALQVFGDRRAERNLNSILEDRRIKQEQGWYDRASRDVDRQLEAKVVDAAGNGGAGKYKDPNVITYKGVEDGFGQTTNVGSLGDGRHVTYQDPKTGDILPMYMSDEERARIASIREKNPNARLMTVVDNRTGRAMVIEEVEPGVVRMPDGSKRRMGTSASAPQNGANAIAPQVVRPNIDVPNYGYPEGFRTAVERLGARAPVGAGYALSNSHGTPVQQRQVDATMPKAPAQDKPNTEPSQSSAPSQSVDPSPKGGEGKAQEPKKEPAKAATASKQKKPSWIERRIAALSGSAQDENPNEAYWDTSSDVPEPTDTSKEDPERYQKWKKDSALVRTTDTVKNAGRLWKKNTYDQLVGDAKDAISRRVASQSAHTQDEPQYDNRNPEEYEDPDAIMKTQKAIGAVARRAVEAGANARANYAGEEPEYSNEDPEAYSGTEGYQAVRTGVKNAIESSARRRAGSTGMPMDYSMEDPEAYNGTDGHQAVRSGVKNAIETSARRRASTAGAHSEYSTENPEEAQDTRGVHRAREELNQTETMQTVYRTLEALESKLQESANDWVEEKGQKIAKFGKEAGEIPSRIGRGVAISAKAFDEASKRVAGRARSAVEGAVESSARRRAAQAEGSPNYRVTDPEEDTTGKGRQAIRAVAEQSVRRRAAQSEARPQYRDKNPEEYEGMEGHAAVRSAATDAVARLVSAYDKLARANQRANYQEVMSSRQKGPRATPKNVTTVQVAKALRALIDNTGAIKRKPAGGDAMPVDRALEILKSDGALAILQQIELGEDE